MYRRIFGSAAFHDEVDQVGPDTTLGAILAARKNSEDPTARRKEDLSDEKRKELAKLAKNLRMSEKSDRDSKATREKENEQAVMTRAAMEQAIVLGEGKDGSKNRVQVVQHRREEKSRNREPRDKVMSQEMPRDTRSGKKRKTRMDLREDAQQDVKAQDKGKGRAVEIVTKRGSPEPSTVWAIPEQAEELEVESRSELALLDFIDP